jgi:type II secretory pathway pseudopilin PulG
MKTQLKFTRHRKFGLIKSLKCNQQGFTLAETIVVFAVIFIASTGTVGLFSYALQTASTTAHITAATYTARLHIEEIKATTFGNITTSFPDGVSNPITGTSFPNGATWSVTYPDGTGANPLTISVNVSWSENGETKLIQLMTQTTSP